MRTIANGVALKGVTALLFTPFSPDRGVVDRDGMLRQIDAVLEAGVDNLVACGKAGEFEGLALAEIGEVLEIVQERVAGRAPVGMGIISVEAEEAVAAAAVGVERGIDFAMVKKKSRSEVRDFYLRVAERLPVMIYDQSNEGDLDLDEHLLPLIEECERIVGVKVSGNVYGFEHLKKTTSLVPFSCGWDTFSLLAYQSGADGVVAGSASVMPEREVALHRLALEGRWDEAGSLFYEQMLPLIAFATPDPYAFSVCKLVLHWRGVFASPVVRPPYMDAPGWMQSEMRSLAGRLGLLES